MKSSGFLTGDGVGVFEWIINNNEEVTGFGLTDNGVGHVDSGGVSFSVDVVDDVGELKGMKDGVEVVDDDGVTVDILFEDSEGINDAVEFIEEVG